ncbi:cobyrinate a,c-diamide synthase [Actibacterium sp. 188UL27-1]|uniref:cobyrinate a,c-diamide synthase n=1 Tax=Actibacterium sp. 188UL27-1 TaxID=2786961 RepID=UPI00195A0894|nr:cobyrinate a,c-diamide synthase [Actibacterium sp. 188UL27-1]MBM7067328.1 cobyrinate a,c-diamide synthase [Actibacterium sp. 188UL27-1]
MTPTKGGLVIGAPASGSGKTTVSLALMRALARRGPVRAAKSGPDYIDPRFHEAACGHPSINLDAWAMTPDRIRLLAAGDTPLIVEGAMGLFDGAPPQGQGSTADLAVLLDLPVLLVIDAVRMAHSVAALVGGYVHHRPDVRFCGIILNRVGSARHEAMLRGALDRTDLPPVLGAIPRQDQINHPSRHLGLVQAAERSDLSDWLDRLADLAEAHIDLDLLPDATPRPIECGPRTPPPAQHIAMAQDQAFAFAYPHLLADWRERGAQISYFSPLADDPVPDADLVILPGGYPELHAGRLARTQTFLKSLRNASKLSDIYGECGGYMVLGQTLTDAQGQTHPMAGLLDLDTSFARRKLHLGYRQLEARHGPFAGQWRGHEFHYATTTRAQGETLFAARDAAGDNLAPMGLRTGRVCGSFAHVIDRAV